MIQVFFYNYSLIQYICGFIRAYGRIFESDGCFNNILQNSYI